MRGKLQYATNCFGTSPMYTGLSAWTDNRGGGEDRERERPTQNPQLSTYVRSLVKCDDRQVTYEERKEGRKEQTIKLN